MGYLTRKQLEGIKPRTKSVNLAKYGVDGTVFVRALTAAEESNMAKVYTTPEQEAEANMDIAVLVTLDKDGNQLLDDEVVKQFPGWAVRKIANTALELSGMKTEAADDDAGKSQGEAAE